jgi:hypothetical protein
VEVDGPLEQDHLAGNGGLADVFGSLAGRDKANETTIVAVLLRGFGTVRMLSDEDHLVGRRAGQAISVAILLVAAGKIRHVPENDSPARGVGAADHIKGELD